MDEFARLGRTAFLERYGFGKSRDYLVRNPRTGEQWALEYEQHRLLQEVIGELFQRVDWVSDRLGDGAGYDILSFELASAPRYIEVKTTNGAFASSFIISRNELDFSREVDDAFCLYLHSRAVPPLNDGSVTG